jgi:hypothetical protein
MFTVPKDGERNRLILDARPPNVWRRQKIDGSSRWLNHFFLEEHEEMFFFTEDIIIRLSFRGNVN